MKVIVFAGFFLIGFVCSLPVDENKLQNLDDDIDEKDVEDFIKAVQEYVDKKCDHVEGQTKNVKEILIALDTCLDSIVPNRINEFKDTFNKDSSDEVCSDVEKIPQIRQCFQPTVDLLKDCTDKDEKYLPEFFFDAIDNLYSFICADDGKNLEKVFQNSTMKCIETITSDEKAMEICEDKLETFGINESDNVLTKTDLCSGMVEEKTCYSDYIRKQCPNDSNLRELFEGVMNSLYVPCTK